MGDLLEAYRLWWHGPQDPHHHLWWWDLYAWGRAGKVAQGVAAVTIILDLLGAKRLKGAGKWAKQLRPSVGQVLYGLANRSPVAVLLVVSGLVAPPVVLYYLIFHVLRSPAIESPWLWPIVGILWLLGMWLLLSDRQEWRQIADEEADRLGRPRWLNRVGLLLLAVAMAPVAGAVLAVDFTLLVLPWIVVYAAVVVILKCLGWLMDRAEPARLLRVLAAILFFLGLHFDILAS
ncbi:hypothetical protein Rhe02_03290 [Rhizocola hellebori]|uniref:Uncharacterized protein n=1 Tax=Rhizocola hellebori TaxID=1392758 RepID=A0A8J3VDA5_9ACTN|nr:hypothetical protein [Rhizocola hellebori]GIH02262.1 hypothetical protein Rhe02_03290 [Rhizocola hellebori]